MKKALICISGLSLSILILMSFSFSSESNSSTVEPMMYKNSCEIIVKNSSGSTVKNAKVIGDVCGGISCSGHTKAAHTDSYGVATVYFSSGCKLCAVFVDGKEYSGTYKDGGTYTINKK